MDNLPKTGAVPPDYPPVIKPPGRGFSLLPMANPFGAPVYYRDTVDSTMDAARTLGGPPESSDLPHGTVIAAGYQSAGRGRSGRPWNMDRGSNLPLTVILRYPAIAAIPPGLTLRTGLALSLAVEDFVQAAVPGGKTLAGRVKVKWPNDIMLIQQISPEGGKKAAGILAETAGFSGDSGGGRVYLGVGVNIAQRDFPPELRHRACSIAGTLYPERSETERTGAETGAAALVQGRFILLEKFLARLYAELEGPPDPAPGKSWRERLLERLYMRGRPVRFIPGAAGSGHAVEGILAGIGAAGELLITLDGEDRPFVTGELDIY
ncbi:MAG: biotin--[acetyl-CoA-carboxylase] ligase [Spirochaetaceae bacterium]|jgi:BirA family biotin operon repressor/biotin-[acetyl-CoA-carboxylase] ligase|nr:biotin--[acetyl-CoA-carboxylase] ligase [Spirochaetaceae bacterium]